MNLATTGSSTSVLAISDTAPSVVVANNANGYFIQATFGTGTLLGSTFRFYGCRITYTYASVASESVERSHDANVALVSQRHGQASRFVR